MKTIDSLIIGCNNMKFDQYLSLIESMGENHPDYKDLNLNYISIDGRPYRALDILDYYQRKNNNNRLKLQVLLPISCRKKPV